MHQILNYYLKSTKTYRSAKVLSGKFIELNMASQVYSKYAQHTCFNKRKLRKQICIKLTFIPFEEMLRSTELVL